MKTQMTLAPRWHWALLKAFLLVLSGLPLSVHAQEACDDQAWGKPTTGHQTSKPKTNKVAKRSTSRSITYSMPAASLVAQHGVVVYYDKNGVAKSLINNLSLADFIQDGDVLQTEEQSFASVQMGDGSHLVIPSRSKIVFKQISKAPIQINLEQGQVDNYVADAKQAASKRKGKVPTSYRVRTPAVTLSVRGTQFRVTHDESSNVTRAGVTEGAVAAQRTKQCGMPLELSKGEGVLATGQGIKKVALLPAPNLDTLVPIVRGNSLQIQTTPVEQAQRYRIQLSLDESFLMTQQEQYSNSPQFNLRDLNSGFYYVKVSAIDANGIEGLSSTNHVLYQSSARP